MEPDATAVAVGPVPAHLPPGSAGPGSGTERAVVERAAGPYTARFAAAVRGFFRRIRGFAVNAMNADTLRCVMQMQRQPRSGAPAHFVSRILSNVS